MKRQSRRATVLTLLAAFYLPLSLVTGIFGMNIKEFDEVKPPFFLCFEVLFAVIAVTMIFYGLYRCSPLVFRPLRAPISAFFQERRPFCWIYDAYETFSSLGRRREFFPDEMDLENGVKLDMLDKLDKRY
jgi:hypothetical protein